MKHDAHNYKRRLEVVLEKVKNSDISDKNKQAIIRFHDYCFAEGLSLGRIVRYIYDLFKLSKWLGKDFVDANKDDIKSVAAQIQNTDYAEATKRDLRITLRRLYRMLRNSEEYPEEVRWLKTTIKNEKRKLPEEMLSEDDIKKMIEAANNPRNRALIAVLYESGCRIGEFLSIRMKHIRFDEYGAQLIVDGKTGPRRVRIIASVPYLTEWINKHPFKEDREAPLWTKSKGTILSHGGIKGILSLLCNKANINKKIYPHLFRHSRATYLANFLTEAQMKEYFGWVQASDMASVYVHLSGRDVDNALLKVYGMENKENGKEESKLKPKNCIRCKEVNQATNKFCSKCGMVIDEQTVIEIVQRDTERKQADEIMDKLIQDEEFKKILMNKIKELT